MLQKLVKKFGKNKGGFTLIELIVVIAILAVLAAVLIPSVTNIVGTARTSAVKADANTAYMAYQMAITDAMANNHSLAKADIIATAEANMHLPTGTSVTAVLTGPDTAITGVTSVTVTETNNGSATYPQ